MKTFEEYLKKMGYSWNDFDRTYEMENLIEQYTDEKVKQALTIPAVVVPKGTLCECECEYPIIRHGLTEYCSICQKELK